MRQCKAYKERCAHCSFNTQESLLVQRFHNYFHPILYLFLQNELREELQCYRDYLAVQAEEEAKKERELDSLVNEEVQRQWAKRVEQWRKEREARKKLMQDVLDTRKKQIQEKRK